MDGSSAVSCAPGPDTTAKANQEIMNTAQTVLFVAIGFSVFLSPTISSSDPPALGLKRSLQLQLLATLLFVGAVATFVAGGTIPYLRLHQETIQLWAILVSFASASTYRIGLEYLQSEMSMLITEAMAMLDKQKKEKEAADGHTSDANGG